MKKYMVIGVVVGVMIFGGRVSAMSPLVMSMSSDDEADGVAVVEGDAGAVAVEVEQPLAYARAKSNMNTIGADGDTQLHKAVKDGDVERAQRLLDRGANPNLLDAHGCTPFYYACMQEISRNAIGLPIASEQARQQALVRSLYLAGADDAGLETVDLPFYILETIYRAGLADRLVQENSRVFCELDNVDSPLALWLSTPDVIAIVKAYVGVSDKVQNHPMKSRIAKQWCWEDQAMVLLNSCVCDDMQKAIKALYVGADINSRTEPYGSTALHIAVRNDRKAMVKFLVDNRACVDVQTKAGGTPLSTSVEYDRQEIARLLLESRVSPDIQENNGRTALQVAIGLSREGVVRLLLEKRANCDIQDNNGETALHTAVKRGKKEIVRLLLEQGASVTIKDKAGKTPLDVSRELKQHTCVVS